MLCILLIFGYVLNELMFTKREQNKRHITTHNICYIFINLTVKSYPKWHDVFRANNMIMFTENVSELWL